MTITVSGQATTVKNFALPSVALTMSSVPTQLSTSQLPLLFPRGFVFENSERSLTFGSSSLNTITFEICVIVEAVRQGTQDDTYDLTRQIMDELQSAIESNAAALYLDFYTIRETFETAGETVYFAVVASLRTSA